MKFVLFDLLSALIDSWSLWNEVAGGKERGRAWRMNYLARSYDTGAYEPYMELVADSAEATGLPRDRADEIEARWDDLQPWPEAGRALRGLSRRGATLGVATNCSDELGRRAAERLGTPFAAVVTAESAGCYKPCSRMYVAGAEAIGASPEDVLFVAGSPFDVRGAAAAGMVVAWHNRAGLVDEEAEESAVAVLRDLGQLTGLHVPGSAAGLDADCRPA